MEKNGAMPEYLTPPQVWAGFDPGEEALDAVVLREWSEDGIRFREVYFNGREFAGEKTRIYAIYSAPLGGERLPGMLHVHGGGQTVSPAWLKFWNRRGYAALSFNWGGVWDKREKYTHWGKLAHANHRDAGERLYGAIPNVRASSWYEWAIAAMRSLTLLERQPEVDGERLGAFGISMGGTLMWIAAAVDRRIKAGCAVYGAGWESCRDDFKYASGDEAQPVSDTVRAYRMGMSAESYAPYIRCPMLFLNSTNDHHGNMDRAFDTTGAIPQGVPRRQAYTPGFRHHIGPAQADNLPLWMDTWLKGGQAWPETPTGEIRLNAAGVPELAVAPDASQPIRKAEFYYAIENPNALSRHWRPVRHRSDGTRLVAVLPILNAEHRLFAYANVYYGNGICLTSNLCAAIPAALGAAGATDRPSNVIYDGSDGLSGWITNTPATDPVPPLPRSLRMRTGPGGKAGLNPGKLFSLLSYAPGDPKWRGKKDDRLTFRMRSECPQTFSVIVKERESEPGEQTYSSPIAVGGSQDWQTVRLAADMLRQDKADKKLEDWTWVNYLELRPPAEGWEDGHILFTDFIWEQDDRKPLL